MFSGSRSAAPSTTGGAERRAEAREAVRRRARLMTLDGGAGQPCLILDISSRGMRVQAAAGAAPVGRVVLVDLDAGRAHEADVAWAKGREFGVRLAGSYALSGLVPRSMYRAKQVWMEHAADAATRAPAFGRLNTR